MKKETFKTSHIRGIREGFGICQIRLGKAVGLSHGVVSRVERNLWKPNPILLLRSYCFFIACDEYMERNDGLVDFSECFSDLIEFFKSKIDTGCFEVEGLIDSSFLKNSL